MALDKFKAALRDRIEKAKTAQSKVVRIGVVEHQHYDDGTPVAYVAAIHEYGSPSNNIPARPFFRPTISEKQNEWKQDVVNGLIANQNAIDVLELVGMKASADVKNTISEIMSPPLSVATKKARNNRAYKQSKRPKAISIKPLIDTGLMQKSISYVVSDKE